MKVYVMSAERRSGVSKKTNKPYDSVVIQGIYTAVNKYVVKELWIDPAMLEGAIPAYGDVLDVSVGFGGFIDSVKFVEAEKVALNVRKVGNQ